jgi:hypothetical protein
MLMRASAEVASSIRLGAHGWEHGVVGWRQDSTEQVSQSGRDVDVAFYALDRKGNPVSKGTSCDSTPRVAAVAGLCWMWSAPGPLCGPWSATEPGRAVDVCLQGVADLLWPTPER